MVRIDLARMPALSDMDPCSSYERVSPSAQRPGGREVSNTIRPYYQSPSNNTLAAYCASAGSRNSCG
jgi:hypothetical protein